MMRKELAAKMSSTDSKIEYKKNVIPRKMAIKANTPDRMM
jgi:hypothetical protein